MITYDTFEQNIRSLVSLQHLYTEHVKDNDDFLPHVFMGDVARLICATIDERNPARDRSEIVTEVLKFLEHASSDGDPMVIELITVSFLENIADESSLVNISYRFGPSLRHMLEDYLKQR